MFCRKHQVVRNCHYQHLCVHSCSHCHITEKSIQRISIGSADGLNRRSSAEIFDDPSTLTNSMNAPNRKDVEMSCDSEHDKDVLAAGK